MPRTGPTWCGLTQLKSFRQGLERLLIHIHSRFLSAHFTPHSAKWGKPQLKGIQLKLESRNPDVCMGSEWCYHSREGGQNSQDEQFLDLRAQGRQQSNCRAQQQGESSRLGLCTHCSMWASDTVPADGSVWQSHTAKEQADPTPQPWSVIPQNYTGAIKENNQNTPLNCATAQLLNTQFLL